MGCFRRGDVIADRYQVRRELGRGRQATVWEVRHTGTGHIMCVKVFGAVEDGETADVQDRILQEATLTAGLTHPNTVRVFDFGALPAGGFYIGMERIVGESMAQRLKSLKAAAQCMTEEAVLHIGASVLGSLAEAHSGGLIHRDLKPANIMLQPIAGTDDAVRVVDFGMALQAHDVAQLAGRHAGTLAYVSPEQLAGRWLDGRSDLFALAVIMVEALTGVRTELAIGYATGDLGFIENSRKQLIKLLEVSASEPVRNILYKALKHDPNDRHRDAGDMLEDVVDAQRALVSETLFSTPTPAPDNSRAPASRKSVRTTGSRGSRCCWCRRRNSR